MPTTPADGYESWLPDLTGTSLVDLAAWDIGNVENEMLARIERPSSQVAGSSGS